MAQKEPKKGQNGPKIDQNWNRNDKKMEQKLAKNWTINIPEKHQILTKNGLEMDQNRI